MYHKLKYKNKRKYRHKIDTHKDLIKLRDDLQSSMQKSLLGLLNSNTKVPYSDKPFFETKMIKRRGHWWVKYRLPSKWTKYKKFCRY